MSVSVGKSTIVRNGLIFHVDAASLNTNYSLSEVEVLVVAGGGGGGYEMGGGGGAGGVIYRSSYKVTPNTAITVTVGAGGAGRTTNADNGGQGSNSVFGDLTALGGGAGGNNSSAYDGTATSGRPLSGGSGGGAGEGQARAPGTTGQGNQGGGATENGFYHSGGGGGAGFAGENGNSRKGGNGGDGLLFNISGRPVWYAGGGGGGVYGSATTTPTSYAPYLSGGIANQLLAGRGGKGGGGNAGNAGSAGQAGATNTGGGGGGGSYSPSSAGGAGGSGVVIVRYPGPQRATGGNTITQVDGYTVHTFTSGSSSFTPLGSLTDGATLYGIEDLVGNSCVAAVNSPTYSIDGGGSVRLLSANTQTLKASKPYPDPVGLYTWEIWLKITALSPSGSPVFFHKGNHYTLRITGTDSYYWADGSVYSYATYGNRTGVTGIGALNVWKQLVITKDSVNDVRLYINGSLVDTRTSFGTPVSSNLTTTCWLWGYSDSDTIPPNTNMGDGYLAIARMYDRQLSTAEVLQNFSAQRGRFGI